MKIDYTMNIKSLHSLLSVIILFAMVGCVAPEGTVSSVAKCGGEQMEIYSQTPSRTSNSGLNTLWSEGDAINIFHAESGSDGYLNDGEFSLVEAAEGRFQGRLNVDGELVVGTTYDWYACYPYSAELSSPKGAGRSFVIGSVANAHQTQNGNGNTAHLAGEYMPSVGVAKGVKAEEKPSITMLNVSSMVEFRFKNNGDRSVKVKHIAFSVEGCALVGAFNVDFSNADNILCTPQDGAVADTAVLQVENPTAIASGSEALFYVAVAPFKAQSGSAISFDLTLENENGVESHCTKSQQLASTTSFVSGKCKTIVLNFDAEITKIEVETGELPSMGSEVALFKTRIMCYNVRNCKGMDDVVEYQRVGRVIARQNPDVVAVQELDSMTTRYKDQYVLKNIGDVAGMYATFGAACDYKGGKYGVGVLSKEEPLSHRRVTLPCTNEERVLLIVEFKDYYFCSTHYSLLEEYRIIASNIICEEAAKLDKPMFVAGDFNTLPDAEPMQILAQDFYIFKKDFDNLTFPADKPTKEIDFICMYKHHSVVPVVYNHIVVPAIVESDHRPIVADVEVYKR